jgi:hypothetical protein
VPAIVAELLNYDQLPGHTMDDISTHFGCSVCGRALSGDDLNICLLCAAFICREHMIERQGFGTCPSCAPERERRESGVSASDQDRVVSLLRADVDATVGPGHADRIVATAKQRRWDNQDAARYAEEVVDDVQQYLHDTFVDTTWPSCPHHPNHPLGFADGMWRCGKIATPLAPLGGLSAIKDRKRSE